MKKLFKEFKDFISKGNVMDLAVGMIIGAAFTAIITALVNGILKPLINLIPIGDTGLQTVLREAVLDEAGTVKVEALILDWGSVISAIITFILTALVLFIIIKTFNTFKAKAEKAKAELEEKMKKEKKEEAEAAEEAVPEVVEEPKPTTEELLQQIIVSYQAEHSRVAAVAKRRHRLLVEDLRPVAPAHEARLHPAGLQLQAAAPRRAKDFADEVGPRGEPSLARALRGRQARVRIGGDVDFGGREVRLGAQHVANAYLHASWRQRRGANAAAVPCHVRDHFCVRRIGAVAVRVPVRSAQVYLHVAHEPPPLPADF